MGVERLVGGRVVPRSCEGIAPPFRWMRTSTKSNEIRLCRGGLEVSLDPLTLDAVAGLLRRVEQDRRREVFVDKIAALRVCLQNLKQRNKTPGGQKVATQREEQRDVSRHMSMSTKSNGMRVRRWP